VCRVSEQDALRPASPLLLRKLVSPYRSQTKGFNSSSERLSWQVSLDTNDPKLAVEADTEYLRDSVVEDHSLAVIQVLHFGDSQHETLWQLSNVIRDFGVP
jgi:hypothetical protein